MKRDCDLVKNQDSNPRNSERFKVVRRNIIENLICRFEGDG
jgi:hypothetical protein